EATQMSSHTRKSVRSSRCVKACVTRLVVELLGVREAVVLLPLVRRRQRAFSPDPERRRASPTSRQHPALARGGSPRLALHKPAAIAARAEQDPGAASPCVPRRYALGQETHG